MSRPIKFRAWDTEFEKWIDIVGVNFDTRNSIEAPFIVDYLGTSWVLVTVELMQFTGLTDKNGKEVFEGDILEWDGDDYKMAAVEGSEYHVVEWSEQLACWKMPRPTADFKIIGNVFEHPELLK